MSFIWNRLSYVLYGVFWVACLLMFMQDYLGQEGYIQYCRDHWVHLSPWWGFGGAALSVYAFWYPLKFEAKEREELVQHITNLTVATLKKEKPHE